MEWLPIESAPDGWVRVSMRDVDREPPEWVARKERFWARPHRSSQQMVERECWMAQDDGRVCGPTHWMSP